MRTERQRQASRTSLGAAVLWIGAMVAYVVHLAIRPPCPDGYVRLLDVPFVLPEVSGFFAVVCGALWTSSRMTRREDPSGRIVLASILVGVAVLAGVGSLIAIGQDFHPGHATNCWTF